MSKRNHKGHIRQFTIQSQLWYAKAALSGTAGADKIQLGMYNPDGGNSGEFVIEWEPVGAEPPTARLKVYSDGWSALAQFQDVLTSLAKLDSEEPTVEQVAEVLKHCGVIDVTERVRPKETAGSADSLDGLAEVCRTYQQSLDRLRDVIRDAAQDPTWGAEAELGAESRMPQDAPVEVWTEFLFFAQAVAKRRLELTEVIARWDDAELAERHRDLLIPEANLKGVRRIAR